MAKGIMCGILCSCGIRRKKVKGPSTSIPSQPKPLAAAAPQSTKLTEHFDSFAADVENLLECSICLDLCSIPIQQCTNGHNICAKHLTSVKICPICRATYENGKSGGRNRVAELFVEFIEKKKIKQEAKPLQQSQQQTKGTKCTKSKLTMCRLLLPITVTPPMNQVASTPTITSSPVVPSLPNPHERCPYSNMGCTYSYLLNSTPDEHPLICAYRPLQCCFKETGECLTGMFRFGHYISHLKNVHGVKLVRDDAYCHKSFIMGDTYFSVVDNKEKVRTSSVLFILQTNDGATFVVRAGKEDKQIIIWVAFHGAIETIPPSTATIEFKSEPKADQPDSATTFLTVSKNISATTRMNLEEVLKSGNYASVQDDQHLNNVKNGRIFKSMNYWKVNVTISKNAT